MSLRDLLPSIIAHARSGALGHAWRLFSDAGLDLIDDDPAVLSVRGRLLKDRALAAPDEPERRRFYLEAAAAYARAAELSGGAYPLINATTLSLLAGRHDQARALARQVLDRPGGEPETPYYRAATRAEALLLLGETQAARTVLTDAVALAPRAWEDHASTLRQFALILDALGEDKAWLDVLRPPRTLHFAGHMALAADAEEATLRIGEVLDQEHIGFGYGALAAGADIAIAEALLDRGAELHLVLPGTAEAFREASVARLGDGWAARFDAVIARAETVRSVGPAQGPPSALAIRLAAEVAMGAAAMQAAALMTEAVQLLVLDDPEPDPAGASAWSRAIWARGGRRRHVLVARRDGAEPVGELPVSEGQALAAILTVDLVTESGPDSLVRTVFPRLKRAVAQNPPPLVAPRWSAGALVLAFATPAEAARAALAIAAGLDGIKGWRIGGHYGLVWLADDPFGGAPLLLGEAAELPAEVVRSTPPGAIHLTEDFAAALHAAGLPHTEYVGDLPAMDVAEPVRLFSLRP